jgi:hypothetical protein
LISAPRCPYEKPHSVFKSLKLAVATANFRRHQSPVVGSLYAALLHRRMDVAGVDRESHKIAGLTPK